MIPTGYLPRRHMAYTLPRDHPRHPGPVVWHLTLILLMVTITTRFADSCSPTSDLSPQTLYNMSDTVVSGRIDRALTGSDGILTLRVRVYCQFKGDAVTSQFLSVSVMGSYDIAHISARTTRVVCFRLHTYVRRAMYQGHVLHITFAHYAAHNRRAHYQYLL